MTTQTQNGMDLRTIDWRIAYKTDSLNRIAQKIDEIGYTQDDIILAVEIIGHVVELIKISELIPVSEKEGMIQDMAELRNLYLSL